MRAPAVLVVFKGPIVPSNDFWTTDAHYILSTSALASLRTLIVLHEASFRPIRCRGWDAEFALRSAVSGNNSQGRSRCNEIDTLFSGEAANGPQCVGLVNSLPVGSSTPAR
jgi:hypothetical protein